MKHAIALSSLAVLLLAGCKPDAAVKNGAVVDNPKSGKAAVPAPNPATLGDISGVVHFNGKAPARVKIDMSQDPACAFGPANESEQYIVQKGMLANVFVYVKNAPEVPLSPAMLTPVVIDQKGCRFTPHVAAVVKSGSVEFRNSDPTMHNVHSMPVQVGNRSTDVSQAPGAKPETLHFSDAENMIPIRCNNHPWMNAFLNVSPTPFYAVTDPTGAFHINGVPQGNYTLVFVHEKLGTQEVPVTVKAGGTAQASATFTMKSN